jgi:hypothetical protein
MFYMHICTVTKLIPIRDIESQFFTQKFIKYYNFLGETRLEVETLVNTFSKANLCSN